MVDLLRLRGALPADLREARTDREPLPGAIGWPEDDDHDKVAKQVADASQGTLTPQTARYLTDTYGMVAMDIARKVAEIASTETSRSSALRRSTRTVSCGWVC